MKQPLTKQIVSGKFNSHSQNNKQSRQEEYLFRLEKKNSLY